MSEFPPELKNFVDDAGRLKQWPSKQKLQLAAMPVFAGAIPADRHFTEREINELLNQRHTFGMRRCSAASSAIWAIWSAPATVESTGAARTMRRRRLEMTFPAMVYHAAGREQPVPAKHSKRPARLSGRRRAFHRGGHQPAGRRRATRSCTIAFWRTKPTAKARSPQQPVRRCVCCAGAGRVR